ncbi:MAG: B12-binding domain-containing radical SAM protein [Magnetococcales bacterium]|nr:B12-binding domain-containing radical SAM protein [Magnetococcales bacterium]
MNTVSFVTYLTRDMELMPVGVLTLAALTRQQGWDVTIEDLPRFDDESALVRTLSKRQVVGFSTLCSTFHRSLRLASQIKALNPQVLLVMGGPQASAVAVSLLQRHACVDLIFRGEAEAGWAAFLEGKPWSEIPGLVYRHQNAVQETPPAPLLMDLDQLPFPAFDLYPATGLSIPLETGRGCPFACTYCSTNRYFSRRFRAKSPARILAEMDQLNRLYGVRAFDLIEDSFTTNRRKILEFCDAIALHSPAYSWNISARPDQVDDELLGRLRQSGCRGIFFGIETGSQRLQKVVKKNLRVAPAMENIAQARHSGLMVTASFIIGFPDETETDLRETLRVFGILNGYREMVLQLHLLSPLAGSALVAAQTELVYDGMPTDFNELDESGTLTLLDRERFRQEPELFPHMHYFPNAHLPRSRYLFLAYVIRLCGWFFPNFLHQAFRLCPDAWIDHLLTAPEPPEWIGDASFPNPMTLWNERGHGVCLAFARQVRLPILDAVLRYDQAYCRVALLKEESSGLVSLPRTISGRPPGRLLPELSPEAFEEMVPCMMSRDSSGRIDVAVVLTPEEMEQRLQELCGTCGECCLDEDGLMCGVEEWSTIAQFLESHHQAIPGITPTAWQGLVLEEGCRYLAHPIDGPRTLHDSREAARLAAGEQGWVRHACAHLEVTGEAETERFQCAIQSVKPAECVAYPYRPMGDGGQRWHLEPVEGRVDRRCALIRLLREKAVFRQQYLEWARSRMGQRSGAVALGRLHAEEANDLERRA